MDAHDDQDNQRWKQRITDEARLRGYSDKTIKSYIFYTDKFLRSGKNLKEYLLDLINRGKSPQTVRSAGFAVKFYLKVSGKNSIENKEITEIIKKIPNMKKDQKLPIILSKSEIEQMIDSTKNLNHRIIIMAGYSGGLRVSEIVSLKWNDIDFNRNVIHIKLAKGKKDRIVMLSAKLKHWLDELDPDKEGYVFKTIRGEKYKTRTIQKIMKNAAEKSGIRKRVTPHTLRHSFATHLLENGTDLRYIRDLLGHSDVRTTLIYTRVSNKDIMSIKSPMDD